MKGYQVMREGIKTLPLILPTLPQHQRKIVERQFPYSFGIEWEIHVDEYMESILLHEVSSHGIYDLNVDGTEFRTRFHPGIHGLISLYWMCDYLKKTKHENELSGLHYHIDCSEFKSQWINFAAFCILPEQQDWILSALKSWNYTGTYNKWEISMSKRAVKIHPRHNTIEFRIGEMSFDYELIVKRVQHCQSIVQRLKYLYLQSKSKKKNKILDYSVPFRGSILPTLGTYQH